MIRLFILLALVSCAKISCKTPEGIELTCDGHVSSVSPCSSACGAKNAER